MVEKDVFQSTHPQACPRRWSEPGDERGVASFNKVSAIEIPVHVQYEVTFLKLGIASIEDI